jgi:CBS domain-containing protein
MAKSTGSQSTRNASLDRTIERLREQLNHLAPFFTQSKATQTVTLDEFDAETERLIQNAFGETSEMVEAYEYAQVGEAAGLVNFPDEAPEGGSGTRNLDRESLNQRKRVVESCIAELESRRALLAKKKKLTKEALIGPQVGNHMSNEVRAVPGTITLQEASRRMQEWKIGSLFVTDDRRYVGVISDTDLAREVIARGIDPQTPVSKCMRTPPITIASSRPIIEAVRLMKEKGTRHLAVTDGENIVGVISVSNVLRYYSGVV